ncbi:cytochrome-c peroxidase [Olivibacter sitiensis]|uniref:cytochrome-c peroxidase n=1 Tax=Olivibacter sitiensis TaxID=376470 RepID=UPI00055B4412|nr:cytochrome c peroxidase [Olivibacter sitiensis]
MKKQMYVIISLFTIVLLLANRSCTNVSKMPRDKVALGEMLFSDTILSSTRKISCASCHRPEFAFADTGAVSLGVMDRKGTRNTQSAMNLALDVSFFWDGRAATLEEQALIPIANPDEMDLPIDSAVARLNQNAFYVQVFQKIFNEVPNATNLAQALGEFQRSLETNNTPFDDWRMNDNEKAVSESAKRGFALFNGKANCIQCHFGPNFNNIEFRNIGLFDGKTLLDSGRAAITKRPEDLGKFKIGPLRNVALTAPYMHNGMFKTLREVIEYYNDPDKVVPNPINRDSLLSQPLELTEQEKEDLENFLNALTDKRFRKG